MGKQGPCYHCGVTSTPLWRNGPPEKPVLCNACGSRWRTKGTLTNYTPLHSRADVIGLEDYKGSKVKTISIKTKELKLHKRKYSDAIEDEGEPSHSDQNFWKVVEDTSNRSSSGSAISYSESCAHFGGTEVNDWTGSAQSAVWDSLVPSRRRTCVSRPKPSSVEKLTKDLFCILREQQQSSFLSGSSEEDLLFESGTPMDSFEIGHGSVLIKHLREARDEESEASSLPLDKRTQTVVTESYSGSTSLHASNGSELTEIRIVGDEKVKKVAGQGAQECPGRDKISHDNHHLLRNINSPLKFIDLKDVVNFGEFTKHLTDEEQLQLMKYLPSTDTAKLPGSLKSMFDTSQFLETLSSFQQLLLEGIFDLSFPGINAEECRSLKRLALVNLTKSKWVEHYQQLKNKSVGGGKTDEGIPKFLDCGSPVERPRDDKNMHFPDLSSNSFLHSPKFLMKIPKRVQKGGNMNPPKPSQTNFTGGSSKASYESKDTDNEGSCFSPRSLFTFPPDRSSCMLDSFQFSDESSEHDLLYNVPSNACFPQAELLDRNIWKAKPKISEIQVDNHEEALYSHPSTSFSSQKPNNSGLVYSHPVLR